MTLQQATLNSVVILVAFLVGYAVAAQPQPELPGNDPEWGLIKFENGAQWYIRGSSVNAIWAVDEQSSKKLGFRTKIFGTGYEISSPQTAQDIERGIIEAKANKLLNLLGGDK